MAKSEKIRVMISSRCKATIPHKGKTVQLSEVRTMLKEDITKLTLWTGQDALRSLRLPNGKRVVDG